MRALNPATDALCPRCSGEPLKGWQGYGAVCAGCGRARHMRTIYRLPPPPPPNRAHQLAACPSVEAVDALLAELVALPASRSTKRKWYRVAEARKQVLAAPKAEA